MCSTTIKWIFPGLFFTDKSLSEALIFASTNPQYDNRLFIELQVQWMKIPSSEHGENMLCTKIVLNVRNDFYTQHVLPRFELGIFMYWICNSINNLLSYCGLVDAKIRASDKNLPVYCISKYFLIFFSELLKTQGKECLITWLQQTLLDACCVKINGKDMFKSDGKSLEPVLYHFNGKFICF